MFRRLVMVALAITITNVYHTCVYSYSMPKDSSLAGSVNNQTVQSEIKQSILRVQVEDFYRKEDVKNNAAVNAAVSEIFDLDHNDSFFKTNIIAEDTMKDLDKYFERVNDENGMTLVLTGGLYGDCLYKVYCYAIYKSIFEQKKPLHVILPEKAITGGDNSATRDKYKEFLNMIPVNSWYEIVGGEVDSIKDNGHGCPVVVTVVTTDAQDIKDSKETFYDKGQALLEQSDYAAFQEILINSNLDKDQWTNICNWINEYSAPERPSEFNANLADTAVCKPHTAALLVQCLQHLSVVDPFYDLDAVHNAIRDLSEIIIESGIARGRHPERGVIILSEILGSPQINRNINSLHDMSDVIKQIGDAAKSLPGDSERSTKIEWVSNTLSDKSIATFIISLRSLSVLLEVIKNAEREELYDPLLKQMEASMRNDSDDNNRETSLENIVGRIKMKIEAFKRQELSLFRYDENEPPSQDVSKEQSVIEMVAQFARDREIEAAKRNLEDVKKSKRGFIALVRWFTNKREISQEFDIAFCKAA